MSTPASVSFNRWGFAGSNQQKLTLAAGLLGAFCGVAFWKSSLVGFGSLLVVALCAIGIQFPWVVWVVILPVDFLTVNLVSSSISSAFFWGLLTIFLVGCWKEHIQQRHPIEWADWTFWGCVIIWFAWAGVSLSFSPDFLASLKQLGRYLISFAVLLTYLNWLRTEGRIRGAVQGWEGVTAIVAAFFLGAGLLRLLGGRGNTGFLEETSLRSSELGALFSAMIPIQVSFLRFSKATMRRCLFLSILVTALILTGHRTSYFSAGMGMLFILWKTSSMHGRRSLLAVTFLAVTLAAAFLWARYGGIVSGLLYNLSGRHLLWAAAFRAIGQHPLVGIGPGCWANWLSQNFVSVDFLLQDLQGNQFFLSPSLLRGEAHNLFLTQAAEMGLPSLAVLVVLLLLWFRSAGRATRDLPVGWLRALALGSIASFFGFFFHGFFENGPIIGMGRGQEIVVVWLVAALPLVIGRLFRTPQGFLSHA